MKAKTSRRPEFREGLGLLRGELGNGSFSLLFFGVLFCDEKSPSSFFIFVFLYLPPRINSGVGFLFDFIFGFVFGRKLNASTEVKAEIDTKVVFWAVAAAASKSRE